MLSNAYSIRFAFNVLAALAVALLYNGPASGGNFSWGLTLQQLLWLPVGFIGLLMGATLPMLHEEAAPKRRMRFGHRLVQVAELVLALALALALTLALTPTPTPTLTRWRSSGSSTRCGALSSASCSRP